MWGQTQAKIGSVVVAIGGRVSKSEESGSKIERTHLISAKEESIRVETFLKSAVVVIDKTW